MGETRGGRIMKKLHFEVSIRASRKKVWDTMLAPDTYRKWTRAFGEGSYYEGSWKKGARILFLGPTGEGMFSRVADSREHELILLEHLGIWKNGKEDRDNPQGQAWAGAKEGYLFSETNGVTTVAVDTDSVEEMEAEFLLMWPKALAELKELCEQKP
jgi:uncharacterized protein YndB with AHSA1/START domain